jgi:branched-chain amino acid transport system substrate-binding protein
MLKIQRRIFLGGAAALGILPAGRIRAQSAQTIKIGVVLPLSGSQAPVGQVTLLGAQIAQDQINAEGGVLGRQIEFVILDDQANPSRAVAAVREHAGNGINLLLGPSYFATASAVLPIIQDLNVIVMNPTSSDDRFTHSLFKRNHFNLLDTQYVKFNADAKIMVEHFPNVTSWTGIIFEGAGGHDNWGFAQKAFSAWYAKVLNKQVSYITPQFCPLGTTDFKTQIAQLAASPAEGLIVIEPGADGPTFYQQMLSFGLHKKFKVFLDGAAEINVGQSLRNKVTENIWIGSAWNPVAANNKLSDALAVEFRRRTGNEPHNFAGTAHAGIRFYAQAIKNISATETDKIISSLEGMRMDTVKGPGYMRKEDHQFIADVYLYNLKPKDSPPGFEVSQTVTVHMADIIYPPEPGKEFNY